MKEIWIATDAKPWHHGMFLVRTFRAEPSSDGSNWYSSEGTVSDEEYCREALDATGLPQPGECFRFERANGGEE